MTSEASQVLADALRLPEAERARLARQLLDTLSPDTPDVADDELEAELGRRLQEFQQDPTAAVPWSELKREFLG